MSRRQSRSWPIVVGLVALVAVAAALAFLTGGDDPALLEGVATPTVQGQPLAPADGQTAGAEAPTAAGESFEGERVRIPADDSPTIVVFLAHWCPHCQREVPVVQDWLADGGLTADVELVSVATAIDPARDNYPPDEWLASAGWTPPVLVDTDGSVADAYGLTSFPFWVFVDERGRVVGRTVGGLTVEQLDAVAERLSP